MPHVQGQRNPSKMVGTAAAVRSYPTSKGKGEALARWYVILEPKNMKSDTVSTVSPSICHEVLGPAEKAMALQYSCLENPMDRRAWQATVHGVAKSWTQLSDFTSLGWS